MSIHFNRSGKEDGKTCKVLLEGTCYFSLRNRQQQQEIQYTLCMTNTRRRLTLYRQMGYGPRFKHCTKFFEYN